MPNNDLPDRLHSALASFVGRSANDETRAAIQDAIVEMIPASSLREGLIVDLSEEVRAAMRREVDRKFSAVWSRVWRIPVNGPDDDLVWRYVVRGVNDAHIERSLETLHDGCIEACPPDAEETAHLEREIGAA